MRDSSGLSLDPQLGPSPMGGAQSAMWSSFQVRIATPTLSHLARQKVGPSSDRVRLGR